MAFHKLIKVRFGDTDPAGVMYFPHFLNRFHEVFEDWFDEDLRMPYRWVLEDTRVGFPAVHTECDYRAPCRFGEVLDIELAVVRVGNRSFTCRYRAREEGSSKVRVQASIVTALVNLDTFEPLEIPQKLRRKLNDRLEAPVRAVDESKPRSGGVGA